LLLYREALHVPLIVKLPHDDGGGTTVGSPVGLADVMPTVLSLTGIPSPKGIDGVPLFGAASDSARPIFSESHYGAIHLGWSELRSVVDSRYHYIAAPRPELYDVIADTSEKNDVIGQERRTASRLREALALVPEQPRAPSLMSPEESAKLAALGYLTSRTPKHGESIDPKDGIASLSAFEAAVVQFNNGDLQSAERNLRTLLEANPEFTDARIQLARVYETTHRFPEAAETYRQIIESDPSFAEQVLIGLATCYLNLHQLKEARSHAEAARIFNRGGADLLLGRIALAAEDPRAAARYARDAKSDRHFKTAATLLQAEALIAQHDTAGAVEALKVLDETRGKQVPGLELLRADALIRLNRAGEAVAALREAIRQEPLNREIYGRLAAVHLLQQNPAAANAVFAEMVRADPSPAAYEFAARTLDHFGQTRAAAAWRSRQAAR
jgi:tetratricopeptide (TPR) repeat protein